MPWDTLCKTQLWCTGTRRWLSAVKAPEKRQGKQTVDYLQVKVLQAKLAIRWHKRHKLTKRTNSLCQLKSQVQFIYWWSRVLEKWTHTYVHSVHLTVSDKLYSALQWTTCVMATACLKAVIYIFGIFVCDLLFLTWWHTLYSDGKTSDKSKLDNNINHFDTVRLWIKCHI